MKYPSTGNGTPLQTADAMAKRAALRHRINAVRNTQAVYMPFVAVKLAQYRQSLAASSPARSVTTSGAPGPRRRRRGAEEVDLADLPESQPLFLPHQLSETELDLCAPGLAEIESRLRDGQLTDSLDKLRVHLHIRSRLITFKNRHMRHQQQNTRANAKIHQNEAKIDALVLKYRAARVAKLALVGPGDWERRWKVLCEEDIASLQGDDQVVGKGTSEGKRTLSWIWMGADEGECVNGIRELSDGE